MIFFTSHSWRSLALELVICVAIVGGSFGITLSLIDYSRGSMFENMDLPGQDLRVIELALGTSPQICQSECQDDKTCNGWVYVRPGKATKRATPACVLKSKIGPPRPQECCVSGVVRP